jgi:outer membrane protein assembly factor BamE (lipoprotein component of BamABCDE complex)
MKNLFISLIIPLFIFSCTFKKVEKHHGVHFLDKKQKKLVLNKSNRNDVLKLLGAPSTQSTFDNDLWIYIERKTDQSSLKKFRTDRIIVNNVLLLEINDKGLLEKKEFFDLKNMKEIKHTQKTTDSQYNKNSFIYDFLSSLRQKINDPLGKRKKN